MKTNKNGNNHTYDLRKKTKTEESAGKRSRKSENIYGSIRKNIALAR